MLIIMILVCYTTLRWYVQMFQRLLYIKLLINKSIIQMCKISNVDICSNVLHCEFISVKLLYVVHVYIPLLHNSIAYEMS